jgi:hypothetical protein
MSLTRRRVLRGISAGIGATVALPLLDCTLNGNGTALASGAPLPLRFGTWVWGCGMNPDRWNPAATGAQYEIPPELKPIEPLRSQISVLSKFNVLVDGKPNFVHSSGMLGLRTGQAPAQADQSDLPTIDVLIADTIGTRTRFRSLEVTATGNPRHSYSRRSTSIVNPSEPSPVAFYARLFGPDFQDPNAADFRPDPAVMIRRSVLSSVSEDRADIMAAVGAADRARLDAYFSSVRALEQQLELQLQKPPPAEACKVPAKAAERPIGVDISVVVPNHTLLAQLLAMAVACNQTNVFNMVFSDSASSLTKAGIDKTHHTLTHEEPTDPKLGYQPEATWFHNQSLAAWAEFVSILASLREGDGTLLDNCLVLGHSDCSLARSHDVLGIPIMIAGRAGGRVKTGLHIAGNGEPASRVGLTLQQVMGVPVDRWGVGAMQTAMPVSELLA